MTDLQKAKLISFSDAELLVCIFFENQNGRSINQVNSPDFMAIKFTKSFISSFQNNTFMCLSVNIDNSELPSKGITKIEVFDTNERA